MKLKIGILALDIVLPGEVLLIFYIYIGLADFFGVKILKFSIFWGFSEKSLFVWVVIFYEYFFGVCSLIDYFFGSFLISKYYWFFLSFLG